MSQPTTRMFDSTMPLQQAIDQACEDARRSITPSNKSLPFVTATIRLEKGDYAIQNISIPKNSSVTFQSKDKVRLLYIGKRNRPMFSLGENASLVLKEKLEIYYNTNNVQEAMRLMIRRPMPAGKNDLLISEQVKISLFSQKT